MDQWFSWAILLILLAVAEFSGWTPGGLAGPGWPHFTHQQGLGWPGGSSWEGWSLCE